MLPKAHEITAPSKQMAPSKKLNSNEIFKSAAKIKNTPEIPSNKPEMMNQFNFGPFGNNDSNPTTQKGRVLKIRAVSPLGSHCSATTTKPFATPNKAIPTIARCLSSCILGKRYPLKFRRIVNIKPAIIHLNPANNIGGRSETPILIARYVVPQTMQIVIQAR